MDTTLNRFKLLGLWLLPSGIELAFYIFITAVTFVASSMDVVRDLLFVTGDFNPIRSAIAFIDTLLQNFVGERIAGSLSLAIFWGIIGLIVNLIWWLGSNFSTELSNDLVFSKYVHPSNSDPKSHLREFFQRTIIRTTVAIIAIVYTNYFLSQGLPRISATFADVINNWSATKDYLSAIVAIIAEIVMLHMFIVLARLLLLRKQIFDR
ncbi:MAG: hypothetical protein QG628_31 [Patescibacteria group bacterium]|nr:hypothetical protein [Patescibacteria group bacterium]